MGDQMRQHPEPHYAECGDTLSLKYEILQLVNGFLEHDDNNTYGRTFINEGLIDQINHTMTVEHDLRGSVSISCSDLGWLFRRNPDIKAKMVSHPYNLVEKLDNAIKEYHDDSPKPWGTSTLGQSYPVIPECTDVVQQ